MKKLIATGVLAFAALTACSACGSDPVVTEVPTNNQAPAQYPNGVTVADPSMFIALLEGNGYPGTFSNKSQYIEDGWAACAAVHTGKTYQPPGVSAHDAQTLAKAAQLYLCPRSGTSGGQAAYSPS